MTPREAEISRLAAEVASLKALVAALKAQALSHGWTL